MDIGAPVIAGQILAIIDTPEVDQQLIQARADLASAQAKMKLAETTARRGAGLLTQDAVSKQASDEKTGNLATSVALVDSAKANVGRFAGALNLLLGSWRRLMGVVTARKTDIGALVNAARARCNLKHRTL